MSVIRSCPLPPDSLLQRYVGAGAFTDCYATEVAHAVSHPEFVEAFYTTALFRLERWLLRLLVSRPSTDRQAGELARGELTSFAAWSVEDRCANQLLLRDLTGRTRSWLMVSRAVGPSAGTQLFFGSAVVPMRGAEGDQPRMSLIFIALRGFHKVYSRALLRAARSRISRKAGST